MRFEDKVAVVTGAAQGIGEAYAKALAAEGAAVVVADLNAPAGEAVAAAINAIGGRAIFVETDVSSQRVGGRRWSTRTVDGVGGLDLLVNNAAIYGDDAVRPADQRRLGLLPQVHVGEHGRRPGDDPRLLPPHAGPRRRGDRQPELDRGVPLLRLLRTGQGRRQRPDPAARARARRHEHPGQRDRPGPDRHRGHPHPGRRRDQGHREGAGPQADGSAGGHGRRLPVPALRRGRAG